VVSKSRTRRKRTPHEKSPPKLISFRGGGLWGVLFLQVLDLETTQQRNPSRGRGVLSIRVSFAGLFSCVVGFILCIIGLL